MVDPTGRVLDTAVVYLTGSQKKQEEARARLLSLIQTHGVRHIAIGNGTASRETEALTADLIRQMPEVSYMIVNEAGASVYSASPLAAEEFPEYDVNLRSAVSIARRLQDLSLIHISFHTNRRCPAAFSHQKAFWFWYNGYMPWWQ